jgi:hypothetical protein
MAIKDQMLRVLRSPDTQRIRFSFTGTTGAKISVDGSSFRRVAAAIDNDTIHPNEGGVARGWARYDARTNNFNIGPGEHWSRAFDALLVHESVHAAFDLNHSTLPWIDNETAAYIAQGYYLRNSGFGNARLDHLGQPYLGRMIVDSIVRGEGAEGFWLDQLHDLLLSSPQYHSYIRGTFTGDG